MKICSKCNISKSIAEFAKAKKTKSGYANYCKPCNNEYQKAYSKTDKGYLTWRKIHLKRKYGITPEQYEIMLNQQNGLCAICHKTCTVKAVLAVDHCHETKTIRGLLCYKCNTAIGFLEHDTDILQSAIKYLS